MHDDRPDLRHDAPHERSAIRFALLTAALGVGFLILAAILTSRCDAQTIATAACGRPERVALALVAPAILFGGGVRAFVRTWQLWRAEEQWWAWQGAGWFLMLAMLLVLTMSLPALGGFGR